MPGFCRSDAVGAAAAPATYAPQGVVFSTAWARQTTQLAGIADSGLMTGALAVMPHGAAGVDQHIMTGATASQNRLTLGLHRDSGNNFYLFARSSGGTTLLNIASGALVIDSWNAILWSFDLSSASLRHLYVNDVSSLATVTTYTAGSIDYTMANLSLGNAPLNDLFPLNAEIADLWVDYGRLVDFSVVANRRLFFAATTHCLVDKGPTGAVPFGVAPTLFFKGPASGFITNLGTGGTGMSQISGTLTDSPIDPCGV